MNKTWIIVSFIILVLCGFMFGLILNNTGLILESYILMFSYYVSIMYILIQFMEKPKNE